MSPLRHEIPPAVNLTPAILASVPELTTNRLKLRAPQLGDIDALAEIFMGGRWPDWGKTYTREDVFGELSQMAATWVLRGHGWWTVEADTVVGFTGIGFEYGDQEHELGYMITAAAEGQGIAFEAAAAAKAWAQGKVPSLVSYIYPSNTRSLALAERLGATRDPGAEAAIMAQHEEPIVVMRHWGTA